jgi:hypothetical protein
MSDPKIVEAARDAYWKEFDADGLGDPLLAAIAAVTPLIRAAALEEAAQMVEGLGGIDDEEWAVIAQDIRALITPKEQP